MNQKNLAVLDLFQQSLQCLLVTPRGMQKTAGVIAQHLIDAPDAIPAVVVKKGPFDLRAGKKGRFDLGQIPPSDIFPAFQFHESLLYLTVEFNPLNTARSAAGG